MKKRDIYKKDWIGLKTLHEKKGLVFLEAEGGHVSRPTFQTDDRCTSQKSFSGRWLVSIWDRLIMSINPAVRFDGIV